MLNIHQYIFTLFFVTIMLNVAIVATWNPSLAEQELNERLRLSAGSFDAVPLSEQGSNDDTQQFEKNSINTLQSSIRLKNNLGTYLFLPFFVATQTESGTLEWALACGLSAMHGLLLLFTAIAFWDKFINKASNSSG